MEILHTRQKIFILVLIFCYVIVSSLLIFVNIYLPFNLIIHGEKMNWQKINQLELIINNIEKNNLTNKQVVITYENESFLFNLEEFGIYTNKDKVIRNIEGIISSNPFSTLVNYYKIYQNPLYYYLSYEVEENTLLNNIDSIDKIILPQPKSATFSYKDGQVIILKEVNGLAFDKEKLIDLIKETEVNKKDIIIKMPVKKIKPEVTAADLHKKGIKELISSFTTEFNPGQINRTNNLKIATEAINGTILAAGEIFSFNQTVGPRTIERGFKESPIYVAGQIVEGIGGGICQVSSTLYNAVLLADLEIVERTNHGLTVPYIELSRDATVAWGSIDFKFKNNTENYLYIHAEILDNKLTFEIHGTKTNKTVILKSKRISSIPTKIKYIYDNTLPKNTEILISRGQQGYTSQLIKEIYEDNILIESQIVSTDRYSPTTTVIRKGTQ